MRSVWQVARYEFRRMALRRGFLIATLAVPVGLLAVVGLGVLIARSTESSAPIGVVDHAGVLDVTLQATLPQADKRIEIRAYPDEASALAALEGEDIQAFFVLPSTYPVSLETELYTTRGTLKGRAWGDFDDLVRASLLASAPIQVRQRLLEKPRMVVHDISSGRTFSQEGIVNIILPVVASVFFLFATSMASGYMVQVVADEKESRTMELLLTSLTPTQLLGGKALGLLAAALTQLAVYGLAGVVGVVVAGTSVPELRQATVPWGYVGVMCLLFFPAYALTSALSIAIGSAVTEVQQGQQLAGLIGLAFMLPAFLAPMLLGNPRHPLVIVLSLFPVTSFLTISIRWGVGSVPWWQVAAGWVLLIGSAALALWAAVRVFRTGMLRYGQPLALRHVLEAVRGG